MSETVRREVRDDNDLDHRRSNAAGEKWSDSGNTLKSRSIEFAD